MKKLIAAMLLALAPVWALAQWQPTKTITNLYGINPGSGNERTWRIIHEQLEREGRAVFTMKHMPGVATVLATNYFRDQPADGHHVQIVTIDATWIISELFNKSVVKYTMDDFVFGPSIGSSSMVILAHPSVPVNNMAEFVQYFRDNHKQVTIGIGTSGKIPAEDLFAKIGVKDHKAQLITYKSGNQAALDVAGNHIPFALLSAPIAYSLYKDGRVKYIAQTGKSKIDLISEVSLAKDTLPGLVHENTWGLMFPRGTSKETVAWYEQQVQRISAMPEIKERHRAELISIDPAMQTGAAFRAEIERQRQQYLK